MNWANTDLLCKPFERISEVIIWEAFETFPKAQYNGRHCMHWLCREREIDTLYPLKSANFIGCPPILASLPVVLPTPSFCVQSYFVA